jgi:hypothetical protein
VKGLIRDAVHEAKPNLGPPSLLEHAFGSKDRESHLAEQLATAVEKVIAANAVTNAPPASEAEEVPTKQQVEQASMLDKRVDEVYVLML